MDRASRRAVLQQLTMLGEQAARPGTSAVPTTRAQLRQITAGWRALLTAHAPTSRGRCPVCSGWLRRRKWPCQVWLTAHQQLIGDGRVEQNSAPAQRDPARPPRDVEIVPRTAGRATLAEPPAALPAGVGLIHRAAVVDHRLAPRP